MTAAAILAGGLGMRLRPTVRDRPKVLAPVAGRPFLSYLLDQLAGAGAQRVVLCTGYLGEQVRAALGDRYGALELSYSEESTGMGTAGALRLALPVLDTDPVLVLNGDSYCGADLNDFASWHQACGSGGAGSLVLTWVEDASRFGTVDVDGCGIVLSFREKTGLAIPGWINAGVYLLSRRLVTSIPVGSAVSIERDVFPAWVGRGLRAYRARAPFLDIGTPDSYAEAESFFANCNASSLRRLEGGG
ncbi:MAG: nucleotidyltransferase family protein [Candidatus Binatia bacterium]